MASHMHEAIGTILKELFPHYRIHDEVAVSELVPSFPDNRKKVDWYVKELRLVIEAQGQQHYNPISLSGGNGKLALVNQVKRDIMKISALQNAGYFVLEVPYWDKITQEYLYNQITVTMQKGIP